MRPPKFNLFHDPYEACAEQVLAVLQRNRGCNSVYVAEDGGLRVIPDSSTKQNHRPDSERIGRYRYPDITVEDIEADLLAHLHEVTRKRLAEHRERRAQRRAA